MDQTLLKSAAISILYVEDDQDVRDLLLSMLVLRYPEHSFFTADNGLQGLDRFQELRPEIIITDISMPEMDGISMASGIREIAPETIIIAVTAHSETRNLLQAIEIGINHYVMKPVDYERFCCVIDQSIETVRIKEQLRDQHDQIITLNTALTTRTQELESLNVELEAFNYTVAHDLRSPMFSICGCSQILLKKLAADIDEQSIECLQVIYKETMHMNKIIEALLNFSRFTRKSIAKQWTDISSIANKIARNLKLREPQRQVTFTIAEGVRGFADPTLLDVVLENLLGNAWKYSAKNDAACIEFGSTNLEEELVYFVRDNGVGFDHQESENLFVPFQRLQCNKEFEGFGIGLATASRIIQRHGGRIWADGEKGRGATFYFSL
ncbi:MAG: response regulator [Desulfuromonadales bacterium]|nr:response regulator [Desulfuromonadales bacterium]